MLDHWLEPAAIGDDRCAVCWKRISQYDVGPAGMALCILGTAYGRHVAARRCICRRCRQTIVEKVPLSRSRPWEALGMTRGAWYRYGKPTERPADYRPQRRKETSLDR